MRKVLIFMLVIVLIFSCVSCGYMDINDISSSDDQYNGYTSSKENSEDNFNYNETVYASDKVVNRFINEFNAYSDFEMGEITNGNIRTKFFGNVNGCYIEMINANDTAAECFNISISGGKEITERDKMFEVAFDVIKVLDPSIDDNKIAQVITYLKGEENKISDYKITDNMIVETYVPIVELSYGKSDCRIDIISINYK